MESGRAVFKRFWENKTNIYTNFQLDVLNMYMYICLFNIPPIYYSDKYKRLIITTGPDRLLI